MKIHPLLLVPAAAAEMDDAFNLLAVASMSSTASNLIDAVGHRNVSKMEALIQNLADESISEPGWKFDDDIKQALHAIRDMFVKSIQTSLKDAHKTNQEQFNCFTKECFGGCIAEYKKDMEDCRGMNAKCEGYAESHVRCRRGVYSSYKDMAQKCGALHCFEIPDPVCDPESCLCPDLAYCHRAPRIAELSIAYPGEEPAYPTPVEPGYPVDSHCEVRAGNCNGKFGGWLLSMVAKYQAAYEEWEKLYGECKDAYHIFLSYDMECDVTQKQFERCMCEKNSCEDTACNAAYDGCEANCWSHYVELVKETECLEKDRKIDWSATKKIECYIDVLLHDYSKEELLTKCGSETCVNDAREADYKHCATICPQIDYDGYWPEVHSVDPVHVAGHEKREPQDQYFLGDGAYECDVNGDAVFTKHRGGVDRAGEIRCTEHLDIDYQIPQCVECEDPPEPVCDEAFHYKWYLQFDDASRIGCINDCCPEDRGATCFEDVTLPSSSDGLTWNFLTIKEHTHAWAYNRCPCTECISGYPAYPGRPEGRQCGMGAHTISPGKKRNLEFKNVCIEPRGDNYATIHIDKDVCVKSMTFTHLEGQVSCRKRKSGDSNWGCDGDSLGLVLAETDGPVTAPVFDTAVGMTPHYSKHAHWYRMDGVSRDSKEMTWTFKQPFIFAGANGDYGSKEYRLWYNEDLTGGTEHDNRGRACYDVEMESTDTCDALAPLQFADVCTRAKGDNHATIHLPADTCVTEIVLHHVKGYVSCAGTGGASNFGCGHNLVAMVWTNHDDRSIIMPHSGQVEGFKRTGHGHAHWYTMDGVTKDSRRLSHKLSGAPLKVAGSLDLWYNEDLSGGTESDNKGRACYEVSVHRAASC